METFKVVLTPESVDEIIWCDHSNDTPPAVLPHGTIILYLSFLQTKFEISLEF